jgi:hypothetical protein
MIIHLTKSKLFTCDPADRFAGEHGVSPKVWKEMWRRYKLLEYKPSDLASYYHFTVGSRISTKAINRWIVRTEIYCMSTLVTQKGVRVVKSEYFKHLEPDVVKEVTRNLKYSGTKNCRTLL